MKSVVFLLSGILLLNGVDAFCNNQIMPNILAKKIEDYVGNGYIVNKLDNEGRKIRDNFIFNDWRPQICNWNKNQIKENDLREVSIEKRGKKTITNRFLKGDFSVTNEISAEGELKISLSQPGNASDPLKKQIYSLGLGINSLNRGTVITLKVNRPRKIKVAQDGLLSFMTTKNYTNLQDLRTDFINYIGSDGRIIRYSSEVGEKIFGGPSGRGNEGSGRALYNAFEKIFGNSENLFNTHVIKKKQFLSIGYGNTTVNETMTIGGMINEKLEKINEGSKFTVNNIMAPINALNGEIITNSNNNSSVKLYFEDVDNKFKNLGTMARIHELFSNQINAYRSFLRYSISKTNSEKEMVKCALENLEKWTSDVKNDLFEQYNNPITKKECIDVINAIKNSGIMLEKQDIILDTKEIDELSKNLFDQSPKEHNENYIKKLNSILKQCNEFNVKFNIADTNTPVEIPVNLGGISIDIKTENGSPFSMTPEDLYNVEIEPNYFNTGLIGKFSEKIKKDIANSIKEISKNEDGEPNIVIEGIANHIANVVSHEVFFKSFYEYFITNNSKKTANDSQNNANILDKDFCDSNKTILDYFTKNKDIRQIKAKNINTLELIDPIEIFYSGPYRIESLEKSKEVLNKFADFLKSDNLLEENIEDQTEVKNAFKDQLVLDSFKPNKELGDLGFWFDFYLLYKNVYDSIKNEEGFIFVNNKGPVSINVDLSSDALMYKYGVDSIKSLFSGLKYKK